MPARLPSITLLAGLLLVAQGCTTPSGARAQVQQATGVRTPAIQSAAPPAFNLARQRTLAATCAACHGTEGRPPRDSIIPPLAAMPRGYMALQLRAFRDGRRPSTVMQQLAQGLTDVEIEALDFYYATLKR